VNQFTCRLLPYSVADGPTNMATDEALLQSAQKGLATLRFYAWSPPTLSLGYFQSENPRNTDPLLASLPFVRRPSGGDTLVHDHEVTYALALPPGPWQQGQRWIVRMHEIIATALATLGVTSQLCEAGIPATPPNQLCFHHFTAGDLLVNGAKVVGSAQRKQRGALLQHGGILLARSPHTPTLPGLLELTGRPFKAPDVVQAVQSFFAGSTGATLMEQVLSAEEQAVIAELKTKKYESSAWNLKR